MGQTQGKDEAALLEVVLENKPNAGKRVRAMLAKGVSPDAHNVHGWSALHVAAYHGAQDALVALLEANAQTNPRNDDNHTPLYVALVAHHFEAARSLQAAGKQAPGIKLAQKGVREGVGGGVYGVMAVMEIGTRLMDRQ